MPTITSSIFSGSIPARRTASSMAAAASCCSDRLSSCPQKAPSGVRAALTTITWFMFRPPIRYIDSDILHTFLILHPDGFAKSSGGKARDS